MSRRLFASFRSPTASNSPVTPSSTDWTRTRRLVLLIRSATLRCDDVAMTEPHRVVIARLSADFAAMSQYMARVSADLTTLDRLLTTAPPVPSPAPAPVHAPVAVPAPAAAPAPPPAPVAAPTPPYWSQYRAPVAKPPRDEGWIGKLLAVAGVAVTLIGVVLLLVLAAQAGILRPEIRVAAGAALAAALVGAAAWLYARPGGR